MPRHGHARGIGAPFDRSAPEVVLGPERAAARAVELTLFPGETIDARQVARGRIYARIDGELSRRSYPAVGGPDPSRVREGRGGHVYEETPEGSFVLGARHRHVSRNWPRSVVPWGAAIRRRGDGEIQFRDGKRWVDATGERGAVTLAQLRYERKDRASRARDRSRVEGKAVRPEPIGPADRVAINERCRRLFVVDGALLETYTLNDFGLWAWQLRRRGRGTPIYVHTTPTNERQTREGMRVRLTQSHGCIHIRPGDRDDMMARGLLQKGVRFIVRPYGEEGR